MSPADPDPNDAADAADAEDALEGATDEQWLEAHRGLMASGALPAAELAYLYDPDRDPATVTAADLSVDRDPKEPGRG